MVLDWLHIHLTCSKQDHYDSNHNYITIFHEFFLNAIMRSNWFCWLGCCDLKWIFSLSYWKHSPKLKWFTIVILIWATTAAVWKHGLRSLVCKCLFPYDLEWNWTHIRYSDVWNTCDPNRWFGWPWKLQLFNHFGRNATQVIY